VRELNTGEISVDGVRSPLIEAGPSDDTEAVVFVHGNPGSRLDWQDLVGRSGEFGRALAFDMPGFGQADKPRNFDYRIEGYAEFLDMALQQLGVERAHLVVHDFGGPMAIAWAAQHPDAFASAVLLNTASGSMRKWHLMAKLWRTPVVGELVMALTNRAAWRRALSAGGGRPLPDEFIDRMYDDYDRATRRAVLRLYRATDLPYPPASDWVATLNRLDRPALIVWGAKDPFIGRKGARALQADAFPSAEIVMLDQSGHWPFIDDPERTVEAVVPFLRTRLGAEAPA
jgi:pimeloyl-ACP methyl ester carboxylesterase